VLFNLRVRGRYHCRQLGSLVLQAHVGPPPTPSHQAAHLDGDPRHNCLENLAWATPSENAQHKMLHGTQPLREKRWLNGEDHYRCTRCDTWLPRPGFHRNKSPCSRCGITSWCRRCSNSKRSELRRRRNLTLVTITKAGARNDDNGTRVR
jgi:hypothetical protein